MRYRAPLECVTLRPAYPRGGVTATRAPETQALGTLAADGSKRRSGINVVGDVPWGTHFCQFYETSRDLVEILVPYFREGLAGNEFCMWVTSEPLRVEQAKAALREAVPDLDRRIAAGQIEILDYSEWYTRSGEFHADEVLQGWVDKLAAARRRGYEGLRLTGNTFWLEDAHWDDFTRYEEAVNDVIGQYRMLAICTYSLHRCGAMEVADVVANHQFALLRRAGRWEIIESAHHRKMANALEAANEELEAANEELRSQAEELGTQAEELEVQAEELRVANEQLRAGEQVLLNADRNKNEFLAMLAHELRNPLAAISTALHLIERRGAGDPALERAHSIATRQTAHMARMLDDLLDVSRVARGKVALECRTVDLVSVVESALEVARPAVETRGQGLSVSMPPEPLCVQGDPVRLAQVVTNLLGNAAKYTQPGGHVWLSVCRQGGEVALRVRDDGMGIDAEVLPRVFDLFMQADRALARAQGGLGIGLTMVRSLVQMHGGRVAAHSDGSGRGSEFTVYLPLTGSEVEARAVPATGSPTSAARRILLVDDNADAAEMLATLLEMDGHEVVAAHSSFDAIALASDYRPDVVLLDIGMPGLNGHEVARRLRQDPALRGVTLVAVTGYGQDEDRERSRAAGFDHHLVKPVEMEALRRVL